MQGIRGEHKVMYHRRILRSLGGHRVFSLELSILQNFFYRLNKEHGRLKEYRISPLQYPSKSSSCSLVDDFNDPLTGNWDDDANDRCNKFEPRMRAFLCFPGHGIVGHAMVIEAVPTGCWLGVDIDHTFAEFTLLRPVERHVLAQSLFVHPMQEGISVFAESIGRKILWETSLVLPSDKGETSGSTSTTPFVPQAEWVGKVVKRFNGDGDLMASGRFNCVRPDEPFENSTLEVDNIGVIVFDVFLGNPSNIMSHRRLPIADCTFEGVQGLSNTLDHFNCLPEATDVDAYLGGRPKPPYQFICRKKQTEEKLDAFAKKTLPEEIQALSLQLCCSNKCVRLFRPQDTLFIRQKF